MIPFSKEKYWLSKTGLIFAIFFVGINLSKADSINKHLEFGINHRSDETVNSIGFFQAGGGISYHRHFVKGGFLFDASSNWVLNNGINPRKFEDRVGLWGGYKFYLRDLNKTWLPALKAQYHFNSTFAHLLWENHEMRFHDIILGPALQMNFFKQFSFNFYAGVGQSFKTWKEEKETTYSYLAVTFQGGISYSW